MSDAPQIDTSVDPPVRPRPLWVEYLRLFRIGNVFTALADILMGFLLVQQRFEPLGVLACLLLASACLYTAGMTLNDWFDVERDRQERADRPLASGRIPLRQALVIGLVLLLVGLLWASLAGWISPLEGSDKLRGTWVALALAVCILLYDGALKNTLVAPVMMGACRLFNVLLGMSLAPPFPGPDAVLGFGPHQWLMAAGIGVYIVGVTQFARTEAVESARPMLATGLVIMITGFCLLGIAYRYLPIGYDPQFRQPQQWYLLLVLIAFTIVRRSGIAIFDPQPAMVQLAVKHAIFSLIIMDAAVALLAAGPVAGLVVLSLLVPTVAIGRWLYAT